MAKRLGIETTMITKLRQTTNRVAKLVSVPTNASFLSKRSDSWYMCTLRESVRLSATAAINNALITLARPAFAASSPAIRAMLVTMAAVPPKLIRLGRIIPSP